jgi:uncharacterized protein YbjT (DUF2867 family)
MTALVTGATGFLGGAVTRELLRRGERTRVLVRPIRHDSRLPGRGLEIFAGTLADHAARPTALDTRASAQR